MPNSSLEGQKYVISVFETALSIQQNTLSVFNIIIQSTQSTVSLIRYPFDLVEFHQKIRFHYPKSKISFPTLSNPAKRTKHRQQQVNSSGNLRYSKRRSLRDLLPFSSVKKSNADKIEKYLMVCFQHPIIGISSILKDFTSVQREEDALLTSQHTSTTLTPTIHGVRKVIAVEAVTSKTKEDENEATTSSSSSNSPIISAPDVNQLDVKLNSSSSNTTPSSSSIKKRLLTVDDFDLLKVLGKGCMGKVLLVRSKRDQQLYALKCIKKSWVIQQKEVIHTRAERDILVLLRSQPFLVNLHHVFQTSSQLFLVLDYYPGGDIATQLSLLSIFDQDRTRFYAAEIVHALGILHDHGIVYRDLKPENVLIGRDGHVVLTDFGLSKIFTPSDVVSPEDGVPTTQTFCGTAEYLAPEILLGEKYTYVVDFWSLGTLLFEMLAGTTPFWAETHMEMYKRVLEDNLEIPSHFDPITCNFLTGLLEKEACERLGWGEDGIEDVKLHPYFGSMDWHLVSQRKLTPPSIPVIKDETDLTHFDEMFITMPARISESSSILVTESEVDPFQDFSFDPTTIENVTGASTSSKSIDVYHHRHLVSPNNHAAAARTFCSRSPINDNRQHAAAAGEREVEERRVKKRQSSAVLSFTEQEEGSTSAASTIAGPSSTSVINEASNNRALKKRQTERNQQMAQQNSLYLVPSSTLSTIHQELEEGEEEASSIYSRSSMTFSFVAGGANQRGIRSGRGSSEISIIERPHCPVPGQTRDQVMIPHSNTSTLANSMCSYLTES